MSKPLKHDSVKWLVVHCVANKCNRPFSVETLIACGMEKYGQCSYHYYVRYNGDIIPLLPESVQGAHAKHYNDCSLGIVYEGGLDESGRAADTRTEAQKASLWSLLKALTLDYPDARILGHNELPMQQVNGKITYVAKDCPCFPASKEYAALQPENRACPT